MSNYDYPTDEQIGLVYGLVHGECGTPLEDENGHGLGRCPRCKELVSGVTLDEYTDSFGDAPFQETYGGEVAV